MAGGLSYMRYEIAKKAQPYCGTDDSGPIGLHRETTMPESNRDPFVAETGEQVPDHGNADRIRPSRTRPVSAGGADDQYLSRGIDPWRRPADVLPNLTDGTKGDRHTRPT